MKIERIVLGNLRSNCYILYEKGRAFVIDPGYENDQVIHFLKENDLVLEGIYVTHGHFDHTGGIRQLKEHTRTTVYAPEKDKIWFEKDSKYNQFDYEIPVDVWVDEGDEIDFFDHTFKVIATPGHSEGGTSLYTPSLLFSGDTLFYQSIGRTDLPFADAKTIYQSVKKLYALPDDTIVYPGHGRETTIRHEKNSNPFVRDLKNN